MQYGGSDMGLLYDKWILTPGDLPIDQELAKIGLKIENLAGQKNKLILHERTDINSIQQKLLAGWLSSKAIYSNPSPFSPSAPPATTIDPIYTSYTGRYDITNNNMLEVTSDGNLLFAGFPDGFQDTLTPISAGVYYYPLRNAELSFSKDSVGQIVGMLWKENNQERILPYVGPFISSFHSEPDPNTSFTQQVRKALTALSEGVHPGINTPGIAPGALHEYFSIGPVHGLVDIRILTYVASQNVAGRQIERHGGQVSRIIYYKLISKKKDTYLMVYLTQDDLLTDFDYVDN
jgi:hypothetical protein